MIKIYAVLKGKRFGSQENVKIRSNRAANWPTDRQDRGEEKNIQ